MMTDILLGIRHMGLDDHVGQFWPVSHKFEAAAVVSVEI